jgi:hypothetical protein
MSETPMNQSTDNSEPTDIDRAKALHNAFRKAETTLGIADTNESLDKRAERMLRRALSGRLDPRLYQAAWFVRHSPAGG